MAKDDILLSDISTAAFRDACVYASRVFGHRLEMQWFSVIRHVELESPLEAVFYHWWFALSFAGEVNPSIALKSQVSISANKRKYRADFVFVDPDDGQPLLIVELDGHEFHEKTKAQVELRNRRDRDLQGAEYRVIHFSFSEVMADPKEAVLEACQAANEVLLRKRYPKKAGE